MKRLNKRFLQLPSRFFPAGYFITDGNLEASLQDHDVELIHDAAFELLYTREGRQLLKDYHQRYVDLAAQFNQTYIIQTPTWRANPDWIFKLGYPLSEVRAVNRHAVQFVREIQYAGNSDNILVSGCIGPRKNGYGAREVMSPNEAAKYHAEQVLTFALSDVDFISGMSINCSAEAIGIVQASRTVGVPVVISFLADGDGHLPSGEKLSEVIPLVDNFTDYYAQHFIIQCADPFIFKSFPLIDTVWKSRIHGISINRLGNKSKQQNMTIERREGLLLPTDLLEMRKVLPNLKVFGGNCDGNNDLLDEVCRQILLLQ